MYFYLHTSPKKSVVTRAKTRYSEYAKNESIDLLKPYQWIWLFFLSEIGFTLITPLKGVDA